MDQLLEKLFDSIPKARVIRFFLRNSETPHSVEEVWKRTGVERASLQKELQKLLRLGLLKERWYFVKIQKKQGKKIKTLSRKTKGFEVNRGFRLFPELHALVMKDAVASPKKILPKIQGLGSIKLAVISGVFINNDRARTDLLIVGDKVKQAKLARFLRDTESEIGKPLRYTLMDSKEFAYRMDMYDRFLRDILEFPHEKVINRLRI